MFSRIVWSPLVLTFCCWIFLSCRCSSITSDWSVPIFCSSLMQSWEIMQLQLFSCLWFTHLGIWGLTLLRLCPPIVSLWFLLHVFSCRSFLIDGCSINSCNFVVPLKGGELRVFLLHHIYWSFHLKMSQFPLYSWRISLLGKYLSWSLSTWVILCHCLLTSIIFNEKVGVIQIDFFLIAKVSFVSSCFFFFPLFNFPKFSYDASWSGFPCIILSFTVYWICRFMSLAKFEELLGNLFFADTFSFFEPCCFHRHNKIATICRTAIYQERSSATKDMNKELQPH